MRKYLLYIIAILLLAGAAFWFVKHQSNRTSTGEDAFAVKELNEVSRITLVDQEKKKLELTKTNNGWVVNGKFPARQELVQSLMEVVSRIKVLCPVPKAAHDNVLRQMLDRNIEVNIYTKGAEPVKSYYVGGPTTDNEGTYMLLEEDGKPADQPYITYLPGLKGYLTFRYSTDEENWRSKLLFNYAEDDIKTVKVEYPQEEDKSYIIQREAKDSFVLEPVDAKYKINDTYQQKYIHQYLSFYSDVSFEAFDNTYSLKDSILHTQPYCIMSVTKMDNSTSTVNLFHMPIDKRSMTQYDEKGNLLPFDLEHFHAVINGNKDLVIAQYYVFGKLLRSYKDFYFKAPAPNKPQVSPK